MSFLLPEELPAGVEELLPLACLASGYDQTPVPTTVRVESGRLQVSRRVSESSFLVVPWPVNSGAIVCMTSTLRDGGEYVLLNELARGKLNQVRTHAAEWKERGLETPAEFDRELAELTRVFGRLILNEMSRESNAVAAEVLAKAVALADRLVDFYTVQMFESRQEEEGPIASWLTARYSSPPAGKAWDRYRGACNAVRIGVRWRDVEPVESEADWANLDRCIEAAETAGLPICLGPLIDLGPGMLPEWLDRWSGDLPTLAAFMCDYLETVLARYGGRVQRWIVCAGFNHADRLGLNDDDRLRLAARLFEAALQVDPELDLVVGIAQPWGDYLVHDDQTISPFAFADDLIRAGLHVSAVEVDLRTGSRPRGSWPRDLLDISRMLDLYERLGLPVEVLLSYPSSEGESASGESLWRPAWQSTPDPRRQAVWGEAVAALALCNPLVRCVTWDGWTDAESFFTPAGGLVAADGSEKPLLPRLIQLRNDRIDS